MKRQEILDLISDAITDSLGGPDWTSRIAATAVLDALVGEDVIRGEDIEDYRETNSDGSPR